MIVKCNCNGHGRCVTTRYLNELYSPDVSFIANWTGNTLTVTEILSGSISVGLSINGINITAGTTITALGTGAGGIGTYTMSISQTNPGTAIKLKSSQRYSVWDSNSSTSCICDIGYTGPSCNMSKF